MKQWAKTQATNTKEGFTTLTNSKKRKEAFETIDTYGSKSDKILARVAAGTAVVAGTTAVAATAVYAAPIVSAAMFTASAQAYGAISTTALGTYLWNNPDVGLDAYNLGSDIYNRNWGNISTDILAFAYNGANYGSNYRTGKAANTQLEPTETQRNYNAVMAGRGSQAGASEVTGKIPTVKSGKFNEWFNKLTPDELDTMWQDKSMRKSIERELRVPGGMHEWHMVSRAPTCKRMGVSAEQIRDLRTAISDVEFVNPTGAHGKLGSTTAHNELLGIIDSSIDYNMFTRRLNNWANYRLNGGADALPEGLRIK